jgi:hypothetical protein
MMTQWQGRAFAEYDSMYSAIKRINRAFVAPLDTASWTGPAHLVLNGLVSVSSVGFLNGPGGPPLLLTRTSDEWDAGDDFDEFTDDESGLPAVAVVRPNYPNPFNPSTTLQFVLRQPSRVTLRVFDLLGRQVATLFEQEDLDEGEQEVEFIAHGLASGTYLYRIDIEGLGDDAQRIVETRKMLLIK